MPVFFGFGVRLAAAAPWADALARILDPWDRNPLLERLEANRVHHLAAGAARQVELRLARAPSRRQEAVLRRLLESSAFGVAERLSRPAPARRRRARPSGGLARTRSAARSD